MLVSQVCFDQVADHIGGMYTAVHSFRQALSNGNSASSPVISFVQRGNGRERVPVDENGFTTVAPTSGPFGKYYSWSSANATTGAKAILRESDVVIIHVLYRYHAQWAADCAKTYGARTLIVPHGCLAQNAFAHAGWQKRLWLRVCGPSVLGGAAAIICASEKEQREATIYSYGTPGVVLPWATPQVEMADRDQISRMIRSRHGIPSDALVMLYVGRLHPIKRTFELVKSFARTAPENWHLLVVGPDSPKLTRMEIEESLNDYAKGRIHLVGPAFGAEKYDHYKAADCYVLLSCFENFSYTTAEALVCGLPVLLSTDVALSDDVDRVGCGWSINANDAESVDRGLQRVFSTPSETLRDFGARGRTWAQSHLSEARFRDRLWDLINFACNKAERAYSHR